MTYVTGGWAMYEIDRRRACWELSDAEAATVPKDAPGGSEDAADASEPPANAPSKAPAKPPTKKKSTRHKTGGAPQYYGGRDTITAEDAVRSILAGARAARGGAVLRPSAELLADALSKHEERLCDGSAWERLPNGGAARYMTIPSLTSADVREYIARPEMEDSVEDLYGISRGVVTLGETTGLPLAAIPGFNSLPLMPDGRVSTSDTGAVRRLERGVAPRAAAVEAIQADVSDQLAAAAYAVGGFRAKSHRL